MTFNPHIARIDYRGGGYIRPDCIELRRPPRGTAKLHPLGVSALKNHVRQAPQSPSRASSRYMRIHRFSHAPAHPLVSIIIPAFNRSGTLPRAIESVLKQTFRDFELIVIDDGSIDDTSDIIESVDDPRIKSYFQPNRGVSSARNLGIKNSTATFLAFLDSDDEWMPSKLEKQLEALEDNPDYMTVHTNEMWVRDGRQVNQKMKHRKYGGWIFRCCLPLCLISPSSILMHRKIFSEIGLFKESFPVCEDYELWLRLTSRYPVLFLDEPLLKKYGGHTDQLSKKYWGMDRFRVRALTERISAGDLTPRQEMLISKELIRKCLILENGFRKRGKITEADYYRRKAGEYGIKNTKFRMY